MSDENSKNPEIAVLQEQMKVANHRIDDLEDITKSIYDISFTNKQILEQMKEMNENMKKTNNRIDKIEQEPVQVYKDVKKKIIDTIIGSLVGALITGAIALSVYFIRLK